MAVKPDIRYIQFYTDGSAARQPEPRQLPRKPRAAAPKKKKQPLISPLSVCGIAVAAVMLVLMSVGCIRLHRANQERKAMASYVASLQWQNEHLQDTYEEGLDLEEIRRKALALGMVPEEQVPHLRVQVQLPEPVQTLTVWDKITLFLQGLFA